MAERRTLIRRPGRLGGMIFGVGHFRRERFIKRARFGCQTVYSMGEKVMEGGIDVHMFVY